MIRKSIRKCMKAIKIAAGDASKTDGLRVIKRFEELNKVSFNPSDSSHLYIVADLGKHERSFRRIDKAIKNAANQPKR